MRFERRKPEARKACGSDGDGAALDGNVVLMVIAVRVLERNCASPPLILQQERWTGAGEVAWWDSSCLTCSRLWVPSPAQHKN